MRIYENRDSVKRNKNKKVFIYPFRVDNLFVGEHEKEELIPTLKKIVEFKENYKNHKFIKNLQEKIRKYNIDTIKIKLTIKTHADVFATDGAIDFEMEGLKNDAYYFKFEKEISRKWYLVKGSEETKERKKIREQIKTTDDTEKLFKLYEEFLKAGKSTLIAYPIEGKLSDSNAWWIKQIEDKNSEYYRNVMRLDKMVLTYLLYLEKYIQDVKILSEITFTSSYLEEDILITIQSGGKKIG